MDQETKIAIGKRMLFLQTEMDMLEEVISKTEPDTPEYDKHCKQRERYQEEMMKWIDVLKKDQVEDRRLELEQKKIDNDRDFKSGQLKNEKNATSLKIASTWLQTMTIGGLAWWMADYEENKQKLLRSQSMQTVMKFLKIDKLI